MCEGGVDPRQSPAQLQCPLMRPRGLQVSIRGEAVAVRPGEDVLFVVRQEKVSAAWCLPGATPTGQAGEVWGGEGCVSSVYVYGCFGAESPRPAFSELRG